MLQSLFLGWFPATEPVCPVPALVTCLAFYLIESPSPPCLLSFPLDCSSLPLSKRGSRFHGNIWHKKVFTNFTSALCVLQLGPVWCHHSVSVWVDDAHHTMGDGQEYIYIYQSLWLISETSVLMFSGYHHFSFDGNLLWKEWIQEFMTCPRSGRVTYRSFEFWNKHKSSSGKSSFCWNQIFFCCFVHFGLSVPMKTQFILLEPWGLLGKTNLEGMF